MKIIIAEGERQMGRWPVPVVLLRRDVDAGNVQQNRVLRSADERRLRDSVAHEIRTVLPELQEGGVHLQRDGLRRRQRVDVVRPLRGHDLQARQQRRSVRHRVREEL